MHCALLRESSEAGKTFPIIVGWKEPSVERTESRVSVEMQSRKPRESHILQGVFFLVQTSLCYHGHCRGWRKVKASVCWSMRDQRRSAQCGHCLCVHISPAAPVITRKKKRRAVQERRRRRKWSLWRVTVGHFLPPLRFFKREAGQKNRLSPRERERAAEGMKEMEVQIETSRKGLFSAEVVKMWLKLSCWSVDIL